MAVNMKTTLILLFCFLVIDLSHEEFHQRVNSSQCPNLWEQIGAGCYLFGIPDILNIDDSCLYEGCQQEEAVEYCTKQNGYLVEYQLYDEFELIQSFIKESSLGSYWFWTGASNPAMNKTYVWLKNGNSLPDESAMWESNYPNVLPFRHCVLHTYITSSLINYKCSGYAYPICEMY